MDDMDVKIDYQEAGIDGQSCVSFFVLLCFF